MHIRVIIRPVAHYERGEITRDILRLVADREQVHEQKSLAQPVSVVRIIERFDPQNALERNRIWKALKYLEEQERLSLVEQEGERFVTLTQTGHDALEEMYIAKLAIPTPKKWDGKWRLVMFDIPMSHEDARMPMRQKLGDFGFVTYQKSVFIHPYPCKREVREVATFLGVQDFVRFVCATEISDEDEFKKLFNLT